MRIIIATDGSPEATEAGNWFVQFPAPDDAHVTVVSAVCVPTLGIAAAGTSKLWYALRAQADAAVAAMRACLQKRWSRVGVSVLDGDPREAIPDVVGMTGADLVVVGSRGLGAVRSALLGSVSLAVARRARCAVLVCRGEARPIRHVTVALDGSEPAREALRFFERLPLPLGIAISLIGVIMPLGYPIATPEVAIDGETLAQTMQHYETAQREMLGRSLSAVAAELKQAYGNVDVAMPVGFPAWAIIERAAAAGSDLIVLGARGLGALKRLMLGSVSESVLRHASCPVLVARPRR